MRKSKLILVVPCYNESRRIPLSVFESFLLRQVGISICFVDDGSTDATLDMLRRFVDRNSESATFISMPTNGGKAEAVRQGVLTMLAANPSCEYIGFWDADLATPLNQCLEFLSVIDADPMLLAVVGSRWPHLGADIQRGGLRNVVGGIMANLITQYLRLNLYDSQCGAKIFRADVARDLFRQRFVSRWLFDVEIFKRMKDLLTRHVDADASVMMNIHCYEFPLRVWHEVSGSKLHLSDGAGILLEILRIAWHYRRPNFRMASRRLSPRAVLEFDRF